MDIAEYYDSVAELYDDDLPEERFARLPEDLAEDKDAETALFLGCDVYRRPETALAAIRILKAGGVRFLILREERCCGAYLWRAGL